MQGKLMKIRKEEYLKQILQALLLNQDKPLGDVLSILATKLNTPVEVLELLVKRLHKNGLLVISRDRYALTLEGLVLFINLVKMVRGVKMARDKSQVEEESLKDQLKEQAKGILKKYEVDFGVSSKGYFETKLSKIEAFLVGKKVKFKALLVGDAVGFALEKKASLVCENCGQKFGDFDLSDEKNFLLTYAKIKKQRLEPNLLNINVPRLGCGKKEKDHTSLSSNSTKASWSIFQFFMLRNFRKRLKPSQMKNMKAWLQKLGRFIT